MADQDPFPTAKDQPPTFGLLSIPLEFRNHINELVFVAEKDEEGPTNLLDATPPCKALRFTCRTINDEAAKLYKHAYRQYFSTTTFHLAIFQWDSQHATTGIQALTEQDCKHITSIKAFEVGAYAIVRLASIWERDCGSCPGPDTIGKATRIGVSITSTTEAA